MARKIDLAGLKAKSIRGVLTSMQRVDDAAAVNRDYLLVRWMSAMTVVEMHAIWERYCEARLVAALNHDARHFIAAEGISGVSHVSAGLASFIVRGGNRYFDFRSTDDLLKKSNRWLGRPANPFANLAPVDREYLDVLAAVRNCIVHGSDASKKAYSRQLKKAYGITYAPGADEFLNAKDARSASPARYQSRLKGLAVVVERAIKHS